MSRNQSLHQQIEHAFSLKIFLGLLTFLVISLFTQIAHAQPSSAKSAEGTHFSRNTVVDLARQLADHPFTKHETAPKKLAEMDYQPNQ